MKKYLWVFITLFVVSLPLLLPLLRPGFFLSDDGEWMIIRFSAFYEVLRDGQFPVRFLSRLNHGYGYPVGDFLYPGFMYLGVPLHILGLSFTDTVKTIIGFSMLGSGVFCYFWLKKLFPTFASLAGAFFYLYAPYHVYDVYKRGSVGELLALAVVPFILWQIERKSIFWGSMGMGLLILSHNTLAVLFMPLILLYMFITILVEKEKRNLVTRYVAMLGLGFGISSFFWIPALHDLQYTVFSQTSVSEWNKYFVDVSLIGFQTLFAFVAVVALFLIKRAKFSKHRLTIVFFLVGILSLYFALPQSQFVWNILPVSFVQFPFRFLSVTIVIGAFLTAFIFSILSKKEAMAVLGVFLILTFISTTPFLHSITYFDKGDSYYATNMDTTTVKNEYMPLWVRAIPTEKWQEKVVVGEDVTIPQENLIVRPNSVHFQVNSKRPTLVTINTVYFPGWIVKVDEKDSPIAYKNERGLIRFSLPGGNHLVSAKFLETPIQIQADVVSLVSLIVLFLLTFRFSPMLIKK